MVITDKILKTSNFSSVYEACKDALISKRMISIIGDSGWGKTTALKSFARDYGDIVVYDKASKSMNAKIFFSSINSKLGGEGYDQNLPLYFLIRKVANKFNEDSSNKLLIIDEAGKFTPEALEYLHEFRDLTMDSTGIVLAGPKYFETRVRNWKDKNRPGMPEIFSRIGVWIDLKLPTLEEKIAICIAYGINNPQSILEFSEVITFRDVENFVKNYLTLKSIEEEKVKVKVNNDKKVPVN